MNPRKEHTTARQWFMAFVVGDWLTDPKLSLCRPATRGVWMDALCAMHQLDQCGEITGTVEDLSRLCRCTSSEMRAAISDLKLRDSAEVFGDVRVDSNASVTVGNGSITLRNRRMYRDYNGRKSNRDRKKRFDERKRNGDGNGEGNGVVTPGIKNYIQNETNKHNGCGGSAGEVAETLRESGLAEHVGPLQRGEVSTLVTRFGKAAVLESVRMALASNVGGFGAFRWASTRLHSIANKKAGTPTGPPLSSKPASRKWAS